MASTLTVCSGHAMRHAELSTLWVAALTLPMHALDIVPLHDVCVHNLGCLDGLWPMTVPYMMGSQTSDVHESI